MTTAINKNQMALLMIAGIPVVIILTATWLWYYVASGRLDLVAMLGTANQGALMDPPVAIEELGVVNGQGQPFKAAGERPLWRILILGGQDCDEACQQLLHYTRQIHTAMGKYRGRIERAYLAAGAAPGDAPLGALAEDYPSLNLLYTSAPAGESLVAAQPEAAYFVMDPAGWVILSYRADADGKDIMADLKFLLKNSGS